MADEQLIVAGQTPRPGANAPWCGIGAKGEWTDYRDALVAGKLNFLVDSAPGYWMRPEGCNVFTPVPIDNVWVNYRTDTMTALGSVSQRYGIIQNADAFSILDPFCKAGGVITNAGYTEQGLMFMVLRFNQQKFLGDVYDFDIMCCNSFNGKFPFGLLMSPLRIYCQNMYRSLKRKNSVLMLRHGNNINERIVKASDAVTLMNTWANDFNDFLESAASIPKSNDQINALVTMLFPYPDPANAGSREAMVKQRMDDTREEFMTQYYDAPDNDMYRGTALGFLNAYFDYLSHAPLSRRGTTDHRRLSTLVSGTAYNNAVIEKAMR